MTFITQFRKSVRKQKKHPPLGSLRVVNRYHKRFPKGLYKCRLCDKTYSYISRLRQHALLHDKNKTVKEGMMMVMGLEAEIEDKRDEEEDIPLNKGTRAKFPKGQYPCDMCDKVYCYHTQLIQHQIKHVNENVEQEEEGDLVIVTDDEEDAEKENTKDGDVILETIKRNPKFPKGRYCCEVCTKPYCYQSQLRQHMKSHMVKTCKETGCIFTYHKKNELFKHLIKHHGKDKKFMAAKKYHECPICNFESKTLRDMGEHRKMHDDVGKYPCPHCGKTFYYWQTRKMHKKACLAIRATASSANVDQNMGNDYYDDDTESIISVGIEEAKDFPLDLSMKSCFYNAEAHSSIYSSTIHSSVSSSASDFEIDVGRIRRIYDFFGAERRQATLHKLYQQPLLAWGNINNANPAFVSMCNAAAEQVRQRYCAEITKPVDLSKTSKWNELVVRKN